MLLDKGKAQTNYIKRMCSKTKDRRGIEPEYEKSYLVEWNGAEGQYLSIMPVSHLLHHIPELEDESRVSTEEDEDEGATKKQKSGADEEKILKAQKDETFNIEAKLDRDGQPLYKKLSMDI